MYAAIYYCMQSIFLTYDALFLGLQYFILLEHLSYNFYETNLTTYTLRSTPGLKHLIPLTSWHTKENKLINKKFKLFLIGIHIIICII